MDRALVYYYFRLLNLLYITSSGLVVGENSVGIGKIRQNNTSVELVKNVLKLMIVKNKSNARI